MTRIALLQMNSGIDPEVNFDAILRAASDAHRGGAQMLFTPEMSLLLDRDRERASRHVVQQKESEYVRSLGRLAEEVGIYIALGSVAVALPDGRWVNRSFLFRPDGGPPDHYDKMHMFDVDLADGQSWRESDTYAPGNRVIACQDTPMGRLGLTVCYDLRFPALFEALGRQRCDAISVPAAFTVPTGQAHWHVMLRARAIEASAYVIAAAQVGAHEDGRHTFGHSLVVDPWGEVLLDMGGEEPGLAFVEIDLARIGAVRRQLPSLANRRAVAT